eukprot:365241-Chlamydomonas_euryale.AAC.2
MSVVSCSSQCSALVTSASKPATVRSFCSCELGVTPGPPAPLYKNDMPNFAGSTDVDASAPAFA